MNLYEKYKTIFIKAGVNTNLRVAYFLGEAEAECGLVPVRESCYYKTVDSLRATFHSPFLNKSDAFVSQYLKNTEKCANYVYANRNGNGNEASGDGFKYRGGGMFQETFKNGYAALAKDTGIDFLNNPELITQETNAVIAALWYWNKNGLNAYADADNIDSVSDIINLGHRTLKNGDSNGFAKRKACIEKWKSIIKI